MSDRRMDLRINVVLAVVVAIAIIMAVGAALIAPYIITTGNNTDDLKKNTATAQKNADITNCRAFYNSQLVDDQSRLYVDKAALDVNTNQTLRAALVDKDQDEAARLLADAPALEDNVVADGKLVLTDNAIYQAKVVQARVDADTFLEQCHSDITK